MRKLYDIDTVKLLIGQSAKKQEKIIEEQKRQIMRLSEENMRLKAKLVSFIPKEEIEEQPSLDMNKILYPDSELDLEQLCKQLGLME